MTDLISNADLLQQTISLKVESLSFEKSDAISVERRTILLNVGAFNEIYRSSVCSINYDIDEVWSAHLAVCERCQKCRYQREYSNVIPH